MSLERLATASDVRDQEGAAVLFNVDVQAESSINEEHTIVYVILFDSFSFLSGRARSELFIRFLKVGAKLGYRVRAGHTLGVEEDGAHHSRASPKVDIYVAIYVGG